MADIAEIIVSNVDKKSRTGERPVRLCNYTDVYKNNVVHSKMPFMEATATTEQIKKYGLRSGDIIITKDSESPDDIAVPTFVEEATADMLCGYHLAIVRARDSIDGRFLKYCLEAPQTRVHFRRKANGVTRFGLTVSSIEGATFRIPRLRLQHKIADILRTWDEAVEKLEMIIEREKEAQLAFTNSLVYGTRRLSQFKKTNQFKVYRWFTLPEEWDCLTIGELATEVSERNEGRFENLEVLSCSKHDGFVRSIEYFNKQIFSTNLTGYKIIHRGDFGFPSNHVEEGSVGLQNVVEIGIVSPIYTVFRFANDKINQNFAFKVLKTSLYRHIFQISTSATVNRRGSLRWKEFGKIPFPVPPRDEQDAISDVVTTYLRKITALEKQRDRYLHQKTGLMQKLLTGIWRVYEIDSSNTEP